MASVVEYNLGMSRVALSAVLVAFWFAGSVQAQRARVLNQGNAARIGARSGHIGQRDFPRPGFSSRHLHGRHDTTGEGFVPFLFPYEDPLGYEQPYAETVAIEPGSAIPEPPANRPVYPVTPAARPEVIEIPGAANARDTRERSATVFILTNGERVETRRYMLTASTLSVSIDRKQRSIPFALLDIRATITANHERGIDLRIPADRSEISLRF
jgi:hypothetical protein